MRIATQSAFDASVAQLQRRQQALTAAQEQLVSGKRVLRASDDPAAAAAAERALATEARAETSQRALAASRHNMQLTESALGDAAALMQTAREQLVAIGNPTWTDAERAIAAQALRGLREDLLAVANRTDSSGRYLFGGQGAQEAPLVETAGGVIYTAAAGQLRAGSGEPTALTLDGRSAWLLTPDPVPGAEPDARVSVFDALDRAVAELLLPGRSSTEIARTVGEGLARLDATTDTLSGWRAQAGQALVRMDGIEDRLSQAALDARGDRSRAEDLHLVQAISDFQNRQTGYDAALKTYSIVQRMSLFDFIK